MSISETLLLDAQELSLQQIHEKLDSLPTSTTAIEIARCKKPDLLVPGFKHSCRLSIQGDLGDYCLCGISNAEVEVRGNAGFGLGEAMESGSIILHGNAEGATGAFNSGGLIAIHGNAGQRTAAGMCGGEIVVTGSIGPQGAFAMMDGILLVYGAAGAMMGQRMIGGTIYLRGAVESIAPHLEESRLKEADRLRIGLLLLKAGVEGVARDFRVFRPTNI